MTTVNPAGLKLLPEFQDLEINKRARDYVIGGEKYQRVTTALGIINKPALVPWATKTALNTVRDTLTEYLVSDSAFDSTYIDVIIGLARDRLKETKNDAADLGTATHGFVERIINEGPQVREEVPMELLPAVDGAVAYLKDYDITVIATEQTVWHSELKVAGTFDGLGWMGDKLVLFDWKRAKGIYWEYALQLGAYAEFLKELTGKAPDEAHVVRLLQEPPEDGEPLYEVKVIADLNLAFQAYRTALSLFRAGKANWFRGGRAKELFEKAQIPGEPKLKFERIEAGG